MVPPRISSAIADALEMMSHLEPSSKFEWLSACWNVPLRHTQPVSSATVLHCLRAAQVHAMARCLEQNIFAQVCPVPLFFIQSPGTPLEARVALCLQTIVNDPLSAFVDHCKLVLARWLLCSLCGGHWASLSHFYWWRVDPVFIGSVSFSESHSPALSHRRDRQNEDGCSKGRVEQVLRFFVVSESSCAL